MAAKDFLGLDRRDRSPSDPPPASPFALPKHPPLPVGMSLRTRESSSLALKHIFDQINNNGSGAGGSSGAEEESKREGGMQQQQQQQQARAEAEQMETQQRTGGGIRNQAMEERSLFPLKSSSDGWGDDGKASEAPLPAAAAQAPHHLHQPNFARHADSLSELKKRLPDLDLSFRKPHDPPSSFFSNQIAFGSPISTPSHHASMDISSFTSPASWSMQADLPQATSRPSMSNPAAIRPTAQLTIFYSGTVNVYDDVPADKANAIMVLAGNFGSAPVPEREMSPLATSPAPPLTPSATSLTPVAAPPSVSFTPTPVATPSRAVTFSSPAPSTPSTPVAPPSLPAAPASPSIAMDAKPQAAPKRSHAGIELPYARKASLARFLEKRKDRVQLKQQGGPLSESQDKGELSTDKPSSPKKQCTARSRSPSPSRCMAPALSGPTSLAHQRR